MEEVLMMYELKMPVSIYRGDDLIGSGQLLPNGNELALCIDGQDGHIFELLNYSVDTRVIEEKIPLKIYEEGKEVAQGELFQSGSNICVCPYTDTSFNIMDPRSTADLYVQPDGWAARLDIKRRSRH
jgi:hypothetical protein